MYRIMFIAMLTLTACRGDVHDITMPASLAGPDFDVAVDQVKARNDELTASEQSLLLGYVTRTTFTRTMRNEPAPVGTITVGEAIESQRAFLEEQRKAEEAEAARIAEAKRKAEEAEAAREVQRVKLREAVTVGVTQLAILRPDFKARRYGTELQTTFALANNTDKPVAAFRGTVAYLDPFGEEVKQVGLQYDKPLAPGQAVTWVAVAKLNEFLDSDRALLGANLDTVKASWRPDTVIFADGSVMSATSTN